MNCIGCILCLRINSLSGFPKVENQLGRGIFSPSARLVLLAICSSASANPATSPHGTRQYPVSAERARRSTSESALPTNRVGRPPLSARGTHLLATHTRHTHTPH